MEFFFTRSTQNGTNVQYSGLFDKMLTKGFFWFAESEFPVKIAKYEMVDQKWRTQNLKNVPYSDVLEKALTNGVL